MKIILQIILYSCITSVISIAQSKSIDVEKFISIGGIEQWVTIKGDDIKNPAILFLHGGPGSTLSPYADNIYSEWEKNFILIQWDQRGAGRTFGHNDPPAELTKDYLQANPLTSEQIIADGIELSRHLIKELDKQKIILTGTSWGSIVGAQMVLQHPELFYAYVGHAQIVNFQENFTDAYHKVYKMAKNANDKEAIDKLETLGVPPYDYARDAGKLMRVIKVYEKSNSAPAPDSWWKLASQYEGETNAKHRYDGDDYSFANFMGDKGLGLKPMTASNINLLEGGLNFEIPVYLLQGEADILTSPELTKEYYDKIKAPEKELFILPEAAHGFNQAVVDTQYKIMTDYILPLINQ